MCPNKGRGLSDAKRNVEFLNNKLQDDVVFNSPSSAANFVIGVYANVWATWKTEDGHQINIANAYL